MINYNMRYRGPYEYDKFVLNILQYSNAIHDFENDLSDKGAYTTIKEYDKKIDDLFDQITKEYGFADRIYKNLILLRGE